MKKRAKTGGGMTYRTAAFFSLGISGVMHLLFVVMSLYGREAVLPPEAREQASILFSHWHILVSFLSTFITAFVMYLINFWILRSSRHGEWTKLAMVIVASLVAAVILSWTFTSMELCLFSVWKDPARAIRGGIARDVFISVIVIFSSQLVYQNRRRQQMALEFEALKSENVLTKFQVLKNQMDPHFLFNSLNTLNSMIAVEPEKAQEYVQKLSSVLRYTLRSEEVNSLEEELKILDAYCSMMQIRYGDSLRFESQIDPRYMQYNVIPLSLQALVENAIKHNVISNRFPLTVSIRTVPDEAAIVVSNPIQPKKEAQIGSGIGLANLAERVRLKWQKEMEVDTSNGVFSVKVPLIKP